MWTGRDAYILHSFSHLGYNFLQTRVSLCSSKNDFLCVQVHFTPLSLSIKPAHVAVDHRNPLTVTAACDGYDDSIQDKQVDTLTALFSP